MPEVPQLSRPVIASFRGSGADDQYARTLARLTGRATRTNRAPAGRRAHCARSNHGARNRRRRSSSDSTSRGRTLLYRGARDRSQPGAEQVATAIGISERQLSRVFAADGVSVPQHILSRRLHLAY